MYVEIKENKLLSWCEKPYLDYEYVDINYSTFDPNKYEVQDGVLVDISNTQDYISEQLQKAKQRKTVELTAALNEKANGLTSTLTVNLPATLKKGEETEQVSSYKLLSSTSGGSILTVLSNLKDLPAALLSDVLVTDEGYTILGLSQEVQMLGMTKTQAYFIWLTVIQVQGQITEYFRQTKQSILDCETLEVLENIEISFDEF